MCDKCEAELRSVLSEKKRFALSNRKEFKVDRVEGDDVYLEGKKKPAFHISHVGAVKHWLRDGHFVCGVSSGTTAIKTLLSGKKADCSTCANNASEVWGVLVDSPGVRRDQQSGLAPDPSSL